MILHSNGLNSVSMAAIGEDSRRLVAHIFSVIINSAIVYFFTYTTYRTVSNMQFVLNEI